MSYLLEPPKTLSEAIEQLTKARSALEKALPVLEEHAEDERTFWGAEDKHGMARDAETIHAEAKAVLGR